MSTVRSAGIIASILGTMLVSSCSWLGLPDPTLQPQPTPPEQARPVTLQEDEDDAPSLEGDMQPQSSPPVDTKPAEEHPELVQSSAPASPAEPATSQPAAQPVATTTPGEPPMPTPEQQAAAIKMLQEELATLRAERAAEKEAASKAATSKNDTPPPPATYSEPSRPSAPPVPTYSQPYAPTPEQPLLPEPDAAGRRGLRSPSLPKLLPMDIDGKILGTETTP